MTITKERAKIIAYRYKESDPEVGEMASHLLTLEAENLKWENCLIGMMEMLAQINLILCRYVPPDSYGVYEKQKLKEIGEVLRDDILANQEKKDGI